MSWFSNTFSKIRTKVNNNMEKSRNEFIMREVAKFEDKYYSRIEKFQDKISDLIEEKIDTPKNDGKDPQEILALFDSIVVNYAETKIYPFFESKAGFSIYYLEAYEKLVLDYIKNEKQDFIDLRLDYYKEAHEKALQKQQRKLNAAQKQRKKKVND